MPHDFIPRRDAAFLGWSQSFSTQINTSPLQFGLTVAQAAHYASLHDAFAAAYLLLQDPSTDTRPNVRGKNDARRNAEHEARRLARIIQAATGITDQQRTNLRLTVRDDTASLVPAPTDSPRVFVKLRFGSTLRVTLRGKDTDRRGKPAGVAGAMIFSYVGQTPPDSLDDWKLHATTTKPRVDIVFRGNGIVPGAKVWITAYWLNPRNQRGPAAQPKSTYIQCPTLMMRDTVMRLAA